MKTNDSNSLMDESEIRAALSFLRIDRDAFGHGVQQRVKQTVVRPVRTDDASLKDRGGLLRIAASILPVNLLGANTTVSQTSLAAMGVFQKAIAFLALPAISFLMIAVTIFGSFRIRGAQQSQSLPEADVARMNESVSLWWRRYGWIAAIVFALTLVAPFRGWTTPLLLLFMASAIGTASIVTTLGRAGLVDRNVIGGYCNAMLGILGSASMTLGYTNNTQLLDPHLVVATFYAGTAFLILFVNTSAMRSGLDAKPKVSKQNVFLVLAGFVCLLVLVVMWFIIPAHLRYFVAIFAIGALALGATKLRNSSFWPATNGIVGRGVGLIILAAVTAFFGQTLWRPIGNSTLVRYAETFEPELVGQWSYWQSTARWLRDQGINYDHSAVQARWLETWDADESNRNYLLNHAVSTGLILPPEVIETKEFKATTQRLLSIRSANTQISGVDIYEYVIVMLAEEGALTNEQRNHLAGRLLATWRSLNDDRIQEPLGGIATTITNLLSLIDRPLAEAERKADVSRWLDEYQVVKSRRFSRSGGFRPYSTSNYSDLMATENAVRLMQHYGIHDTVDVLALRAFLRPASSDRRLMGTASVRASVRKRLDQIPGISQPSLWDYIRLNQSLWFAILLVGLCIYATLGSPQILKEANDQK
ncbi:MAG: hypothetical protein ACI814_003610 [Mariniblastus sp.]|jgi:hypothetical protein